MILVIGELSVVTVTLVIGRAYCSYYDSGVRVAYCTYCDSGDRGAYCSYCKSGDRASLL